jgi:hypothetical protein
MSKKLKKAIEIATVLGTGVSGGIILGVCSVLASHVILSMVNVTNGNIAPIIQGMSKIDVVIAVCGVTVGAGIGVVTAAICKK